MDGGPTRGNGGRVARMVWYRLWHTLPRRRGGYLAIVLLVGLVGGLGLGSIAGARRTQSAYPDYLVASHASDLDVHVFVDGGQSAVANIYSPAFTRTLQHLHGVRSVAASLEVLAVPLVHGEPTLPAAINNGEVATVAPLGGEGYTRDRVVIDQGRLPDANRPDEFMATAATMRILHWHLGQVIPMGIFSFAQLDANSFTTPVLRLGARLVGVITTANEVVHDEVDEYPTFAVFSPALTRLALRDRAAGFAAYSLSLEHGAASVPAVERAFIAALPGRATYNVTLTSVEEGEVERAIKPDSIALGVFGLIALVAALLIAAQAISRSLRSNGRDMEVLRALGADPAMSAGDALLGVLVAVVTGALLAVGVAVLLSPLAPIGAVGVVAPSPTFSIDWTVLAGGFCVVVVVLGLVAGVLTVLALARQRRGERVPSATGSSALVRGAMRAGFPAATVAGLRFAVERGRGADAVPVGSAILGAVLAVTVVVTTLTFGSGLQTLVSHPALYGWNWDYAINATGGGNVAPVVGRLLRSDKDVAAWTGYSLGDGQADGVTIPLLVGPINPSVSPPILSGHGVEGADQVVLGATTMAELHLHVGDVVTASYGSPQNAPIYIPPTRLRIVGSATLPAIGNSGAFHPSMGTGGMIATALEPPAFVKAQTSSDPNLNGPAIVVVRLRPGVSAGVGRASLEKVAARATAAVADDPNASAPYQVLSVQQPAEIVNYKAMGSTPAVLASGLALGAVVALGLTLVASVRRRRRDLAFLKTLGFVRRQVAAVVAWQASVAAVVGVVVGVPAGVVVGRVLWTVFAHEIAAVPHPTVPVLQIVIVVGGALVLANVVALLPGRVAARTPTAVMLRTE